MSMTRRAALSGLLAGAASASLAGAPATSVRPAPRAPGSARRAYPAADELIARAGLGGQVGFAVAHAGTGEILETSGPLRGMPPASTAKTFTSLYALNNLGPAHRFVTRVLATGPIVDGRLDGDLILAGGGDPSLTSDALGDMAAELKAVGLREIGGRFLVDDRALPRVYQIDDQQLPQVSYNPAIGGLNLNYNRVYFGWKRVGSGYEIAMQARDARFRPGVTAARMQVVDRRSPVYTFRNAGDHDQWTVARHALGAEGARWLPVRRPSDYAGDVFRTLLRAHGIDPGRGIERASRAAGTVVATHQSRPTEEILRRMLRYSTNLTAEVMGMSSTIARGRRPVGLMGSAAEMNRWLGARDGRRGPRMIDHSGLSDKSRVGPVQMVHALLRDGAPLRPLLKDFRIESAPGLNVQAKTGTLNFVNCLSGFATIPGGENLIFAIFCADLPRRASIRPEDRERPAGAHGYAGRARELQRGLLQRWGAVHGA